MQAQNHQTNCKTLQNTVKHTMQLSAKDQHYILAKTFLWISLLFLMAPLFPLLLLLLPTLFPGSFRHDDEKNINSICVWWRNCEWQLLKLQCRFSCTIQNGTPPPPPQRKDNQAKKDHYLPGYYCAVKLPYFQPLPLLLAQVRGRPFFAAALPLPCAHIAFACSV